MSSPLPTTTEEEQVLAFLCLVIAQFGRAISLSPLISLTSPAGETGPVLRILNTAPVLSVLLAFPPSSRTLTKLRDMLITPTLNPTSFRFLTLPRLGHCLSSRVRPPPVFYIRFLLYVEPYESLPLYMYIYFSNNPCSFIHTAVPISSQLSSFSSPLPWFCSFP